MNSSDFNRAALRHTRSKATMDASFKALLLADDSSRLSAFNQSQFDATAFFTDFEQYLTTVSSGEDRLTKAQAEDVLNSIENVLSLSIEYKRMVDVISGDLNITLPARQTSHLQTAQTILKTYRKKSAEKFRSHASEVNLSVGGFMSKEKIKLTEPVVDIWSAAAGGVLITVTLYIAFYTGIHTGMQYWITRILGSLGTGFLITGFGKSYIRTVLKVNGMTITAVGAAGMFVFLYLVNPAKAPEYPQNGVEKSQQDSASNKKSR